MRFATPRFAPRTGTHVRPARRTERSRFAAPAFAGRLPPASDRMAPRRKAPSSEADFSSKPPSLLHHHPFGAVLPEHHSDRVNDPLVRMPLAIFDPLVLDFSALLEVGIVLVGEAVVPAAVP